MRSAAERRIEMMATVQPRSARSVNVPARRARIAIDARSLGPSETGPGIYARQLIDRMSRIAPDWEFLLYFGRLRHGTRVPGQANVQLRELGLPAGRKAGNLIFEQVLLPAALRSDRCDLLWSPVFVLPLLHTTPQVVTMHDVIPLLFLQGQTPARRLVYHNLLRRNAAQADRILTVSQHSGRDLTRHLHADPEKIRVIWNGLEDGFSPLQAGEERELASLLDRLRVRPPYVLCTAGLLSRKNAHGLLKAFARCAGEELQTLVLTGKEDSGGNGAYVESLRWRARELGIQDRLRLPGFLPRAALRLLYGGALFCADASFYEGFGFPVLEGMACGCPVIAANRSSLPEVAADAALLVDPESIEDMAQAMSRLVAYPTLREELRQRGLRRAACFSWDESARRTLEVFREVLGLKEARSA